MQPILFKTEIRPYSRPSKDRVVTYVPATADAAPLNRLLRALPENEYERIQEHLEEVQVEQRQVLYDPNEPIRYVYFPETMVVSLVTVLEDGGTVEIGTTGYEGMAGLPLFLGDGTSAVQAFAQIPGRAFRMEAATFLKLAATPSEFHQVLLRYTHAFLNQVAQTAACNAKHFVDERCARWLLMTHDRVADNEFPLTHEFLAFMLGVRRAGVSVAMRALQDEGVVRYTRGRVRVIDREGLERISCECYRLVRAHSERLLARPAQ